MVLNFGCMLKLLWELKYIYIYIYSYAQAAPQVKTQNETPKMKTKNWALWGGTQVFCFKAPHLIPTGSQDEEPLDSVISNVLRL